ncbi:hypothetical protein AGABI1DRAFT_34230, partial [Agaricus bisporus var. burnettii JB137-S8]
LNKIPTIGHSGVLTSYITAIKYMSKGTELIEEGYNKYNGRPFKIATMSRWTVVLSGERYVKELIRAPNDILSFDEPAIEASQADYTFGPGLFTHAHHTETVQGAITRNLAERFDEMRDEIFESMEEYIPLKKDWVTINAYETMLHVMCRTTNRYLIGLPWCGCRHPRYRYLNEQLTGNVLEAATIIRAFPDTLKGFASKFLTRVGKRMQEAHDILAPMIEERLVQYSQCDSERDGQANDVVTWLLQTATHDYHLTVRDLVKRILMINFASTQTSSLVLTQVLYDLAVRPEYLNEMRREADSLIEKYGWTKAALQRMRKVDSFLKESHRMNSVAIVIVLMVRKTVKTWTLSDGTIIPPDVYVGLAAEEMNKAEESFQDGRIFKGFRFAEMRDGDGELDSIKYQMVCLSPESVLFGHGRHACPGRFLAVYAIKAVFVYILLNYDVQMENGLLERPANVRFEISTLPDQNAKVMFRKRREFDL